MQNQIRLTSSKGTGQIILNNRQYFKYSLIEKEMLINEKRTIFKFRIRFNEDMGIFIVSLNNENKIDENSRLDMNNFESQLKVSEDPKLLEVALMLLESIKE